MSATAFYVVGLGAPIVCGALALWLAMPGKDEVGEVVSERRSKSR